MWNPKGRELLRVVVMVIVSALLPGCSLAIRHENTPSDQSTFSPSTEALTTLKNPSTPITWPAAHRGGLEFGPDNSIKTIKASIDAGLPLIEIDVRRGIAGDLFLFHDRRLKVDNFAAPSDLLGRPVEELSSEERERVFIDTSHKHIIPAFADVLRLVRQSKSALMIDLKGESELLAHDVAALVQELEASRHVIIQTKKQATLDYLRSQYPKLAVLKICDTPEEVTQALKAGVEIVELSQFELVGPSVHQVGQKARVLFDVAESALDNPQGWEKVFSLGVNIIMTNTPMKLVEMREGH